MKKEAFNKEAFQNEVKNHIRTLYRKTLDEANNEEIFQAVS